MDEIDPTPEFVFLDESIFDDFPKSKKLDNSNNKNVDKHEKTKCGTYFNPEIEAMGSAIAEILLCPQCKKPFCLEAGDPRHLKCNHSVCSKCFEDNCVHDEDESYESTSVSITCHECKQCSKYGTFDEAPVSCVIKQIVQTYSEKKAELENPRTFNRKLKILEGNDGTTSKVEEAGMCKEHSLPIEFGCTTCEQWVCGTCVCLKHSGVYKTTCKVYPLHTAIEKEKNAALDDLNKKIEIFQKVQIDQQGLTTSISKLKKLMEQDSNNLQSSIDIFKEKREMYVNEVKQIKIRYSKASCIISKLNSAKNPVEIKGALDFYFQNKDLIHREPQNNDLFDTWKKCASKVDEFRKENSSFYVKCPVLSPTGWAQVSYCTSDDDIRGLIIKFPSQNPETDIKNALIMEVSYFDISQKVYYPFIEISLRSKIYDMFVFTVDDNPLSKIFMEKCCDSKNSFEGCILNFLTPDLRWLTFGERQLKSPKKLVKIGDPGKYRRPFSPGALGMMGTVENEDSIDVNNLVLYIILEDDAPTNHKFSFITKDENGASFLSLCFGEIREMDEMYTYSRHSQERLSITTSGLLTTLDEHWDDESEE